MCKEYCNDYTGNSLALFDLILSDRGSGDSTACTLNSANDEQYTYSDIRELVNENCAVWKSDEYGIKPGSTIAILNRFGIDQILNVLTALKLGCVFSVIDTVSPLILQKRLHAVSPDFISIDGNLENYFRTTGFIILKSIHEHRNKKLKTATIAAYTYKPHDTVSVCFDNKGDDLYKPIKISASIFLRNLKRNTERLQLAGDVAVLLFPFSSYRDYQPGLILTALLAGIRFSAISAYQDFALFLKSFHLLEKRKKTVLCIDVHLRDILLEKLVQSRDESGTTEVKKDVKRIETFFKDTVVFWFTPFSPQNAIEKWQEFRTGYGLEAVKSAVLFWEHPLFCFIFGTVDPVGGRDRLVEPDKNIRYELIDGFSGKTDNCGTGYYSEKIHKQSRFVSKYLLRKQDSGYFLYAEDFMTRAGIRYPSGDLCRLLHRKFGDTVRFCFIPGLQRNAEEERSIILLIFNYKPLSSLRAFTTVIKEGAGAVLVPDKLIEYSYIPRTLQSPDRSWIMDEYYSGRLAIKAHDPFFLAVSYFRLLLQRLNQEERSRGLSCSTYCPFINGACDGIL